MDWTNFNQIQEVECTRIRIRKCPWLLIRWDPNKTAGVLDVFKCIIAVNDFHIMLSISLLYVSIVSGNGFEPKSWKAIYCANYVHVLRRHMYVITHMINSDAKDMFCDLIENLSSTYSIVRRQSIFKYTDTTADNSASLCSVQEWYVLYIILTVLLF